MTKTFKRIIFTCVLLIALAGAATALVVTGGCAADGFLGDVRNGAVNTFLDATGIKDRIDAELRARAGEIAADMGLSEEAADAFVDSLAISEWEAATLPADATETGTYSVDIEGTPTEITTYDDSGYVTLGAYGQKVTLAVPESAQIYVPFLQYLQYAQ